MTTTDPTYDTTNTEFVVLDPNAESMSVLVTARRAYNPETTETVWKLIPNFRVPEWANRWHKHRHADIIDGEDDARDMANVLAQVVAAANEQADATADQFEAAFKQFHA